jgi:hypothetical protein
VYHAFFQIHLAYAIQVWGQKLAINSRIGKLQRSAIRLLTFSDWNTNNKPLFNQLNILCVTDLVFTMNITLVHAVLSRSTSNAIKKSLNLEYLPDSYFTRGVSVKLLSRPYARTTNFGIYSIKYQCILDWNTLEQQFRNIDLTSLRLTMIKNLSINYCK